MQSKAELSIVIVYIVKAGGIDMLLNCLESIQRATKAIDFETIIVHNCPEEDLATLKARYPEIKLVSVTAPVGYSQASNAGFKQAKADFILWLNPDTIIEPDAIGLMLSYLKTHPNTGAVGPMVLSFDGKYQSCFSDNFKTLLTEFIDYFFLYPLFPRLSIRGICWGKENIAHKTKALPGCCLAFRREVLQELGFLDENYFLYMEEFDLGLRMKEAKWDLFYLPKAKIKHLGGGTLQMLDREQQIKFRFLGTRCEFYYFRKHFGGGHERVLALIIFVSCAIRVIIYALASLIYSKYKSALRYYIGNIKLCLSENRADAGKI